MDTEEFNAPKSWKYHIKSNKFILVLKQLNSKFESIFFFI